jgi:hypothetical protein
MPARIARPIGSIALVAMLLASGVGGGVSANTALAADCLTAPNSPTPEGSHWYYRMDWASQRKCWYLRAPSQPSHQVATQTTSDTPGATTSQLVQPGAQEGSGAPAASRAVPPQSNSSQTSGQAVGPVPAAAGVWPDPPTAVAAPAETESILVLGGARPDSIRPRTDTGAPDDPATTARRRVSTSGAGTPRPPTVTPMEVLLTLALGLAMAGVLSRFALKIASARRRRIIIDHRGSNWINDQYQFESRDDQDQDGFADSGRPREFIDDKLEDEKLETDWIDNLPIKRGQPPATPAPDLISPPSKSLSPSADDLEATRRTIMRALHCAPA